jgi:DNA-binding CsgD family transcriptional regulator
MLQGGFTSVLGASSTGELLAEVVRFTRQIEFETVATTLVIDHFLGESEFISLDNTPTGYRDVYNSLPAGQRDPVMQHCKRSSVPIVWNQETYVAADRGDMWESQARFGYRTGISLALHMPEGRHFIVGVDRDQPLPQNAELARIVADLQLFAVYAQEAAQRVLLPAAPQQTDLPALTPREIETLRWTMEGKTAWEVGNILGITERTAVLHANNATHKLGSANKHQAVLKALRLGLIR